MRKLDPKTSLVLRGIGGSLEIFEAEAQAGIKAGRHCPDDKPVVVDCLRQWIFIQ
ncbi:hypothetical protein [Reyranella sp.]|uniref:hypothetical protein n=1 Tax=Reyranella sp. TaxID=1929291 RepID=UPI003BAA8F6E